MDLLEMCNGLEETLDCFEEVEGGSKKMLKMVVEIMQEVLDIRNNVRKLDQFHLYVSLKDLLDEAVECHENLADAMLILHKFQNEVLYLYLDRI